MPFSASLVSLALAVLPLATLTPHAAAQSPVEAAAARPTLTHYNLKRGLALKGYDPVAYFAIGGSKPQKGKDSLTAEHRGVLYRFASEKNRSAFLLSPERFEPAYGGWCAYAMSKGDKVEVDPKRFLVEHGRLLVFYDGFLGGNTRKKWKKEGGEKLAPVANAEWKKLSGETTADLRHHDLDQGLALSGYDPVSYFAVGGSTPTSGVERHSATHRGVTYRFASSENRDHFLKSPDTYVPRYGGYCAWAMAQGKKVEVDPRAFALTDGALHLFYNGAKRDEWNAKTAELKPAAQREWTALHAAR